MASLNRYQFGNGHCYVLQEWASKATGRSLEHSPSEPSSAFKRGLIAMTPLWPGAIVGGIAIAASATAAGFTPFEIMALSMVIFAGSAQVAMVALGAEGAGSLAIVLTAIMLNLRHILYGLSLSRNFEQVPLRTRAPMAFVLTDESYGLTVREQLTGKVSPAFTLGAGISLYCALASSTLVGLLAGDLLPGAFAETLEFIFPLMFLGLLIPLLKTRDAIVVAVAAGLLAFAASSLFAAGLVILLVATVVPVAYACWPAVTRARA